MSETRIDLETYASVAAALARGLDRAEVLASHGLDESSFDALETRALAAMEAEDRGPDGGVPVEVEVFDRALRSASAAAPGDGPTLEDFARALRVAQEGGKVHERLAEAGLSLELLLRGSAHFAPRLASDPELAQRFQVLMARDGRSKPK